MSLRNDLRGLVAAGLLLGSVACDDPRREALEREVARSQHTLSTRAGDYVFQLFGAQDLYASDPHNISCITKHYATGRITIESFPLIAYATDRNPFHCGPLGPMLYMTLDLPEEQSRIRTLTPEKRYLAWSAMRHTLATSDRETLGERDFPH